MFLTDSNYIFFWEIETKRSFKSIKFLEIITKLEFSFKDAALTYILHPDTYVNKIIAATKQGDMQIWNIKTQYVKSPLLT